MFSLLAQRIRVFQDVGDVPTEPRDFLDFFLAAECEEDERSELQSTSDGKFKPSSSKVRSLTSVRSITACVQLIKRMTFDEILGSCILFLFAG